METILANAVSQARRASRNGRDYYVVPTVLLVSGTLAGSKGALYYPESEIRASAGQWNDTPIVVEHPTENGAPVSGRHPAVLDRVKVGRVYNAHADDKGRLVAEAWIDIEAVRRVDGRILNALQSGKAVEVSTGLYTQNTPAPEGAVDAKGRPYAYVARGYVADHLALLPAATGACSVSDGCGLGIAINAGAEESLFSDEDISGTDAGAADSDPDEQAELIAEVLYGLFGDDAQRLFDAAPDDFSPSANAAKWDPLHHPRGDGGRFIPKGSAEAVSAAKEVVGRVLKGEKTSHSAEEVAQHLSILTVKQLRDLHREHGQKAPGKLRDELVGAVRKRLPEGAGKAADTSTAVKEPHEMTSAELVGYLHENPDFEKKFDARYPGGAFLGHASFIKDAVKAGRSVPFAVRKEAGALEPWEKTQAERVQDYRLAKQHRGVRPEEVEDLKATHRAAVQAALAAGKTVPPEVLKDYPDLAKGAGKQAPQDRRTAAALERYANPATESVATGLFGGDDIRAREGFARLPDGTRVVFTEGGHSGKTGHIAREKGTDGRERIVAYADGVEGAVPVTPTAVEPLDAHLSWRTESGSQARKQGGMFGGSVPPVVQDTPERRQLLDVQKQLNAVARSGKSGTVAGVTVESPHVGRFRVTVDGKVIDGDLGYVAARIMEAAKRKPANNVADDMADNASYFGDCPRDDKGHCKPSGQGSDTRAKEEGGRRGTGTKDNPYVARDSDLVDAGVPEEKVGAVKKVARGFRDALATIGANFGLQQGAMHVASQFLGKWGSIAVWLGTQQANDDRTRDEVREENARTLRDLEQARERGRATRNAAQPVNAAVDAVLEFVKAASHAAGKDAPDVSRRDVEDALIKHLKDAGGKATENASHFATCKRDNKGHCLPGEGGGATSQAEAGAADAPSPARKMLNSAQEYRDHYQYEASEAEKKGDKGAAAAYTAAGDLMEKAYDQFHKAYSTGDPAVAADHSGRGQALANKALAVVKSKGLKHRPPTNNASHFATCKRDDKGHCLPGEGGDSSAGGDKGGDGGKASTSPSHSALSRVAAILGGTARASWLAAKVSAKVVSATAKVITRGLKFAHERYGDRGSTLTFLTAASIFSIGSGLATGGAAPVAAAAFGLGTLEVKNAIAGLMGLVTGGEDGKELRKMATRGFAGNAAADYDDEELADHILGFVKDVAEAAGVDAPRVDRAKVLEIMARAEGDDKPTDNASYFGDCPRDEKGHCKPSGQGGDTKAKPDGGKADDSGKGDAYDGVKAKVKAAAKTAYKALVDVMGLGSGMGTLAVLDVVKAVDKFLPTYLGAAMYAVVGSAAIDMGRGGVKESNDGEKEQPKPKRGRRKGERVDNAEVVPGRVLDAALKMIHDLHEAAGKDPPDVGREELRRAILDEAEGDDKPANNADADRQTLWRRLGGTLGILTNAPADTSQPDDLADNAGSDHPSAELDMTPEKACQILRDGEVHGHPLTDPQRKMFGAKCGEGGGEDSPAGNAAADMKDAVCPECGAKGSCDPATGKCEYCGADMSHMTKPEPGSKGDYHMAGNARQDTVSWLTTNCDCWRHKDGVLNDSRAFTDDDLARLKSAAVADRKRQAALASVENRLGVDLTVNGAGAADDLMAKCKKLMAGEETAEGEVTGNATRTTDEEWLASAPPRIRKGIEMAMAINQREKDAVVARLVANVAGEDQKKAAAAVYAELPPEKLAVLVAALPTANETPAFGLGWANYAGAAVTANAGGAVKDDSDNVLPEPTFNFEAAASERLRKKQA